MTQLIVVNNGRGWGFYTQDTQVIMNKVTMTVSEKIHIQHRIRHKGVM